VNVSRPEFDLALSQVYGNSTLGDWTVKYCSDSELWFSVNPGYGASKKPSFTQPDVWAMLSYDLRLKPDSPPGSNSYLFSSLVFQIHN
jgi:hypothetical protein